VTGRVDPTAGEGTHSTDQFVAIVRVMLDCSGDRIRRWGIWTNRADKTKCDQHL